MGYDTSGGSASGSTGTPRRPREETTLSSTTVTVPGQAGPIKVHVQDKTTVLCVSTIII